MHALSFKQPIAWLIANGFVQVDDRSWDTDYRGPILIHASKGLYEDYYRFIKHHTDIPIPDQDQLHYGGIVGIATLVLCCKPHQLPASITPAQRALFANVPHTHVGFLFEQARPFTIMPCAGKLGIFEVNLDQVRTAPTAPQATLF